MQFDDLWKTLYDWLEASEDNLQKFVIGVGARTKQDFDELRVSCKLIQFNFLSFLPASSFTALVGTLCGLRGWKKRPAQFPGWML